MIKFDIVSFLLSFYTVVILFSCDQRSNGSSNQSTLEESKSGTLSKSPIQVGYYKLGVSTSDDVLRGSGPPKDSGFTFIRYGRRSFGDFPFSADFVVYYLGCLKVIGGWAGRYDLTQEQIDKAYQELIEKYGEPTSRESDSMIWETEDAILTASNNKGSFEYRVKGTTKFNDRVTAECYGRKDN